MSSTLIKLDKRTSINKKMEYTLPRKRVYFLVGRTSVTVYLKNARYKEGKPIVVMSKKTADMNGIVTELRETITQMLPDKRLGALKDDAEMKARVQYFKDLGECLQVLTMGQEINDKI
jgi:hypothetical protein